MGSLANCLVQLVIGVDRWLEILQNITLEPAGYQVLTEPTDVLCRNVVDWLVIRFEIITVSSWV